MDENVIFDYEGLRKNLMEYYETASRLGFPRSLVEVDLKRVREASHEELLQIAEEEELSTDAYVIG